MKKKILSVDDSPSVRKLVEYTLKSKGFQVSSAQDGLAALEIMANEQFDAIVLDINMPRMNGLEFLEKVKSNEVYASIPVIMLTTEGQEEDQDKALDLGATAYIVKPFKPTLLLRIVGKTLASI
ncbi:response regulator [Thermodesulfobacteriota bacterium]